MQDHALSLFLSLALSFSLYPSNLGQDHVPKEYFMGAVMRVAPDVDKASARPWRALIPSHSGTNGSE